MKPPLIILSALVASLAAAAVFQTLKVHEQKRTILDLEKKLNAAEQISKSLQFRKELDLALSGESGEDGIQVSRKASQKKYKITCQACQGEGKHIIGYPGQLDPEVYGCSICRGKGEAMVTLHTTSEQLCATCRGMGSLGKKERDGVKRTEVWTAQICGVCLGKGKTGKTANE